MRLGRGIALGRSVLVLEGVVRPPLLLLPVDGRAVVYCTVSSPDPKEAADIRFEMARLSLSRPVLSQAK